MTVTTHSLGSNSVALEYTSGTTASGIQYAIKDFITAHGWQKMETDLHYSGDYTYWGYRALNKDGSTYKYCRIFTNTTPTPALLHIQPCETYNASTHIGTNYAYGADNGDNALRLNLGSSGFVYVFANSRYIIMHSYYGSIYGCSTGSAFIGCCETKPAHSEDTGPHQGYVQSYYLAARENTHNYQVFPLCKTKRGSTAALERRCQKVCPVWGSHRGGEGVRWLYDTFATAWWLVVWERTIC